MTSVSLCAYNVSFYILFSHTLKKGVHDICFSILLKTSTNLGTFKLDFNPDFTLDYLLHLENFLQDKSVACH